MDIKVKNLKSQIAVAMKKTGTDMEGMKASID